MFLRLVPWLLTCGPLALTILAWVTLYRRRRQGWPKRVPMAALCITSANAAYAAFIYLYYSLKPGPDLPPWKDPETLDLAMLFLTAPIGIVVTITAAFLGAPEWLTAVLLLALLTLSLVGVMEGISV